MSQSNVLLANERRIAAEERSRNSVAEFYPRTSDIGLGALPMPASRYLKTSGGSADMNVDGSSAAVNFDAAAGANEILRVHRLTLVVAAATEPELTEFGDLAALTNGLLLQVLQGETVALDLLHALPAKSILDLAAIFDMQVLAQPASFAVIGRLVLPSPVRLEGASSERLRLSVRDDLSGLVQMRCRLDGALEDTLT